MGYLLKEALKSICGVNQWSYAVFWKIGSQNPKLLIWEDCYYEVLPGSALPINTKIGNQGLTLEELDKCFLSSEAYPNQHGPHVGERVDLLVKKMMANQVHVVGEGLVGRTAFTGNHQWLVSGHFNVIVHPPEVINEVQLQFSSGMQTVAIIPATPHGVIQLGSSLAITENTGFIHDVKSLILHLGCIPGALVSDNYMKDVSVEQSRMPFSQVVSASLGPYGDAKLFNYSTASDGPVQPNLFQDSQLGVQATHSLSSKVQGNLKTSVSTFPIDNHNPSSQGSENPDPFLNWHTSYNPGSGPNRGQSLASNCNHNLLEKHLLVGAGYEECTQHTVASGSVDQPHLCSQFLEPYDGWTSGAQVGEKDLYEGLNIALHKEQDHVPSSDFLNDFNKIYDASEVPSSETALSEINSSAQGDLFDVLGMDFKNKILNGSACEFSSTAGENLIHQMKSQDLTSIQYPNKCTISECGDFSVLGSDHMLDAIVSGVHSAATQTSDDNVSCKTTLTKASCSSAPDSSLICVGSISQQMCKLFGSSKTLARPSDIGASLTASSLGKSDTRNYSQTSSFYGSHSSSWVEQGPTVKHETSIATANSKKSGEVGKQTRKRLKPGENPRPRPKDRQMIQDRVKELREIVPNGAKCSIDALLERTIKHMLFLQSVTQHADKLKQTVDSKIINKDGGLLLKDSFEGGATWAYEVGSQANVYPIVVEDLNAPRQLLVEMLCEERGFFLEIADIIKGMGLTILKGMMETRQDKIWACFAVEANRDVTRMEVFLSLVRLLEQTGKINSATNPNRIAHPTVDHTASVPGN